MKSRNHISQKILACSLALTFVISIVSIPPAHAVFPGVCGSMDIAFIVDTTTSMGGEINNIKADLPMIIAQAQLASQGHTLRLGLITFDGFTSVNTFGAGLVLSDFVRVHSPLTTNIALVNGLITGSALNLGNGAGFPEATDQAKATALLTRDIAGQPGGGYADADGVQQLLIVDPVNAANGFDVPWNAQTQIAILITDDQAGGFNDAASAADDALIQSLGTNAAALGIRMSDVYSGGNPTGLAQLQANAANSGGEFIQIPGDGSGTAAAILEIIEMCGGVPIGGELLPISTTSLLIGGIAANSIWILPMFVGIGVGAYFTRSHWHKAN